MFRLPLRERVPLTSYPPFPTLSPPQRPSSFSYSTMKRRIRSYPKRPSLQRPSAAPAATAALQRASAAPGSTALVQRPSAAPDSVSLALQPHSKRLHSGDSNEHSLALPQRQLLQMGGVQRGESFGDEALRKIYIHAGEEEAAAALEDVHFARIGNERADGAARLARAQLKLAEAERAESKLQQAVESMQRELTHQASVRGELERELQQRERERASLITSIASERNSIDAAAKKYHKDASKCALDTVRVFVTSVVREERGSEGERGREQGPLLHGQISPPPPPLSQPPSLTSSLQDATTKSIAQAAQALEKMPPKLLEQMVAAAAADAVDGGGSGAAAAAASPPPPPRSRRPRPRSTR